MPGSCAQNPSFVPASAVNTLRHRRRRQSFRERQIYSKEKVLPELNSVWSRTQVGAFYRKLHVLPNAFWSLGGTRCPWHRVRFRRVTAKKESDPVPTGTRRCSHFAVIRRKSFPIMHLRVSCFLGRVVEGARTGKKRRQFCVASRACWLGRRRSTALRVSRNRRRNKRSSIWAARQARLLGDSFAEISAGRTKPWRCLRPTTETWLAETAYVAGHGMLAGHWEMLEVDATQRRRQAAHNDTMAACPMFAYRSGTHVKMTIWHSFAALARTAPISRSR